MIRRETRWLTGLLIVITLFSQARVSVGVSSPPLLLSLSILPPRLPADGNVHPAVLVSLLDLGGKPTVALNSTDVLLTSSLESVGKVQPSVTIPTGEAFAVANFTTTTAPGVTVLTATGVGLRTVSVGLETVTATGYPTHLSAIALPDRVPAALQGSGRLLIELQDDVGLPAKAISETLVSLFSSNTKVLNLTQPTVAIRSGEFIVMADYTTGLVPGAASITASACANCGLESGGTTITVLGLPPQALKLYAQPDHMVQCVLPATTCTGRLVIALTDTNGNPTKAQRDITVQIRSSNLSIVAPPTSATIRAGNISVVSSYTALAVPYVGVPPSALVVVSAPGLSSDSATVTTFKPGGPPAQLGLFLGPNPVLADHHSYSSVVVALFDSAGTPTVSGPAGTTVTLTSSIVGVGNFSSITLTVPSGSNFEATPFTSTFVVGSTTLTASGQNLLPAPLTRLSTYGSVPSKIVLKAVTPTIPADGSNHPALEVQLEDSLGSPAIAPAGYVVNVSSSQAGVVKVVPATIKSGQTYAIVNVTAGSVAGTANVTARVSLTTSGVTFSSVTLRSVIPAPSRVAAYTLTRTLMPVANDYPVFVVQLQDSNGNPARARIPTNVTVTSSNTTVVGKAFTVAIGGGKDYASVLLRTLAAGDTELTVFAQGLSVDVIPITVLAYPLEVSISASSHQIFSNQTATISVNVVLVGKSLAGAKVDWIPHFGSVSSPNSTTDASGQASVVFTPKATGVGSVTAIVSSGAFGNRNVTQPIIILPITAGGGTSSSSSLMQQILSYLTYPKVLYVAGGLAAVIALGVWRIRRRRMGGDIASDEAGLE